MHATAKAALPEPALAPRVPGTTRRPGAGARRRPVVLGIRDGAVIWLMAPSLRGSGAFCDPEPGRRRAGVGVLLGGAGLLGPAREQPQLRRVLGQLDRQARRRGAAGPPGEHLLGQPVLQRVVADSTAIRPPTASAATAAGSARSQRRQLVVDLDPQRLEGALGRMAAAVLRGRRDGLRCSTSTSRAEVVKGSRCALADDRGGDPAGEPLLAVARAGSASSSAARRCSAPPPR